MHKQRVAVIIASVLGIIGAFLPYAKAFFYSISLMQSSDGTGYIILIAFAISIIVTFFGEIKASMTKAATAVSLVAGAIPGVLLISFVLSQSSNDIFKAFASFQIGFYLVIIASVMIVLLGLLLKDDTTSIKIAQESVIYCSNCGKQYPAVSSGEYCDECGTKL